MIFAVARGLQKCLPARACRPQTGQMYFRSSLVAIPVMILGVGPVGKMTGAGAGRL